jgi:uncharacterized membrane protein
MNINFLGKNIVLDVTIKAKCPVLETQSISKASIKSNLMVTQFNVFVHLGLLAPGTLVNTAFHILYPSVASVGGMG